MRDLDCDVFVIVTTGKVRRTRPIPDVLDTNDTNRFQPRTDNRFTFALTQGGFAAHRYTLRHSAKDHPGSAFAPGALMSPVLSHLIRSNPAIGEHCSTSCGRISFWGLVWVCFD